jgi:hypothetical protein
MEVGADPERSARQNGAICGASEEFLLSLICIKWLLAAVLEASGKESR